MENDITDILNRILSLIDNLQTSIKDIGKDIETCKGKIQWLEENYFQLMKEKGVKIKK